MDLFIKQLIPFHLTLVTMHQHLHIYYYYSIQEKLFYFRYFIFVTLIKVVQHSIFAFYSPSTRLWKVLLVDILQIGGLPPKSNLILVASLLLGGYFLHLNFFDHDHNALDIVNDLLVKRHNVLIIFRRLKNQRNTYDYIRKYCYTVLSLLQLFALFNVGFIVATELIGLFQILQLPYSFFILILVAIIGEINLLIYYGALFTFSYSLILQGTLAFTLLEAVRIVLLQLKQCLDKVKQLQSQRLEVLARKYRRKYVHILVAISKGNRYVGKAFIPLMLVCCPTNAVLMVSLLIYQEMSLAARVTLSVVVVEQFICVFLVHYIIAIHNDNLGRLARWYVAVHYRFQKISSKIAYKFTRRNLKSSLFIEYYFIDSKPYGFTYQMFGHVSTFNFVKYLLLYSEFLLFVYQSYFLN